ncbi:hypothetical protein TNCV_1930151 [Trichonephila clavipes]|nr:hypothetical protein TNCV_1930151 [Trichonephila clavipes]
MKEISGEFLLSLNMSCTHDSKGAVLFEGHSVQQTCISRFTSGHLKSLTFEQELKVFKICTMCFAARTKSGHTLECLHFNLDEVLLRPWSFPEIYRLMELV